MTLSRPVSAVPRTVHRRVDISRNYRHSDDPGFREPAGREEHQPAKSFKPGRYETDDTVCIPTSGAAAELLGRNCNEQQCEVRMFCARSRADGGRCQRIRSRCHPSLGFHALVNAAVFSEHKAQIEAAVGQPILVTPTGWEWVERPCGRARRRGQAVRGLAKVAAKANIDPHGLNQFPLVDARLVFIVHPSNPVKSLTLD